MKKKSFLLILGLSMLCFSPLFTFSQNCANCGNSYLNASGNDIDYDNIVSTFHSTIARQADGSVLIWGEDTKSNGTTNWLLPAVINNTNYSGLGSETIYKFTGGSNSGSNSHEVQFALLTSGGLWVWGAEDKLVDASITTNTSFQKIFTAGQLPVLPENVKMLFGTYQTLAILSCAGDVYVLSQKSNMRGYGGAGNSTTWYKVEYATNNCDNNDAGDLSGIVAVRGCPSGLMALKNNGEVWTWGDHVYLGTAQTNGCGLFGLSNNQSTGSGDRPRARKMNLTYTAPNPDITIAPKMIGMTGSGSSTSSHYILGTDGYIYSLGDNSKRQLGDRTDDDRNSWVRVKSAANTDLSDVQWISPNEHDNYGNYAVNALTGAATSNLWSWGDNERNMIGGASAGTNYDPFNVHSGIGAGDKLIATETGGHTSMVIKYCVSNFGYVGHKINGSMSDNIASSSDVATYNFTGTSTLEVCGAASGSPLLSEPGGPYHVGGNYLLSPTPSGGSYSVTGPGNVTGNTLNITGDADIVITYTYPGMCGTATITIEAEDITLSVDFGNIMASQRGNLLTVNWSSLKETNNDHFEIEASIDGKNFTKIGEQKSQTKDGNSDEQLNYSFEKNSTEIAFAISLLALGLVLPFKRKIRWMVSSVAIAGILLFGFSCTKNDKSLLENSDSLYIRIAQVDKDGTKSYSKVVKVVKE